MTINSLYQWLEEKSSVEKTMDTLYFFISGRQRISAATVTQRQFTTLHSINLFNQVTHSINSFNQVIVTNLQLYIQCTALKSHERSRFEDIWTIQSTNVRKD